MPSEIKTAEHNDDDANVGGQNVAAVYAKALTGATEEAGVTDMVVDELDSLITDVLVQLPRLDAVLRSALIAAEDKIQLLEKAIGGKASPLLMNFLRVLARHGRLDLLRSIRSETRRIVDQMRQRHRVHVSVAAEMDGDLKQRLTDTLRGMLGGEPVVDITIRPELIGGLVLRVGDKVYDGSIATRLERLREYMINRSVHEIQSGRDRFGIAERN
jgi:F-type H+-transporting ATPase subunit delta